MKVNLLKSIAILVVMFTMISCSSDATEITADSTSEIIVDNYSYNDSELETLKLINDYRVSIGLNPLEKINHISFKSEEHDFYMINNNVVSHDGFAERSENIMKVLGASSVGENIAYNYSSPQAAVTAWLNSPGHKANIEGKYTHFGIAIKINPTNGKKYYTNIFAKI